MDGECEVGGVEQILVEKLSKTFYDGKAELPVLEGISFAVHRGDSFAIVGKSGVGKTTLLRIIGGLEFPTSGKVLIDGNPVIGPSASSSFMFQQESLLPWKTVRGNISFALEARGVPKGDAHSRINKYIEMVGMVGFEHFYPRKLSGGMKQRVALARSLVTEAPLLLMDEPLASLDLELREKLQEEIMSIQGQLGRTLLIVSHDIDEVLFMARKVIVLSDRPATIMEIVDVDLPFPRIASIRVTKQFMDMKAHIWRLLRNI